MPFSLTLNFLSIFDKVQDLKAENEGEFYQWLPSEAKTANIEHQQLYGKIFKVGEGDIDGNMPGERWGCKCGIRFLGNTDSDNWEKADADDIRKTFKAERSLRKARAEAAEAHLKAAKEAEAADLLEAQKDAAQMALVSKIGEIEKRLAKQSEKINKLTQKAAKGNKTTSAPQKSQGGATNAPKQVKKALSRADKIAQKADRDKKAKEIRLQRRTAQILGMKRVEPMTADEAVKDVNPNFTTPKSRLFMTKTEKQKERAAAKYRKNCPLCTFAFEMKCRGIPVEAMPNSGKIRKAGVHQGYELFENPQVKGSILTFAGDRLSSITANEAIQEMSAFPDGSRFGVMVFWKRGGGHIFNCEKANGKLKFYDAQDPSNNAADYLNQAKDIGFFRMDDLELNKKIDWNLVVKEK